MRVTEAVINKLNKLISDELPEIGGIIGSVKEGIITEVIMDEISASPNIMCHYEPNVDFLNQYIAEWLDNGIEFKGVFHTHFSGVRTMSYADKKYINAIMRNMPQSIKYLYFPIFVLPDRKFICYKAEIINNEIYIYQEEVTII